MPRSVNHVASKRRRKKILNMAKGYFGARKNVYTVAKNAVEKALLYAYRDRKTKKRHFRTLWIARINAATRLYGMSYSQFMGKYNQAGYQLNRKVLADLAMNHPEAFKAIFDAVQNAKPVAKETKPVLQVTGKMLAELSGKGKNKQSKETPAHIARVGNKKGASTVAGLVATPAAATTTTTTVVETVSPSVESTSTVVETITTTTTTTTVVEEVSGSFTRPASVDDLKIVEGIGPAIEKLLQAKAIYTFAQLASTPVETIEGILAEAGSRFRIHNPATWPAQAKLAAEGKWAELKKWQDELQAGRE